MSQTDGPTRRAGFSLARAIALGFVVLGVAILIGLGVWQLERKVENARMLAGVAALAGAPPRPLGDILATVRDPAKLDFTRVSLFCPTLFQTPVQRIYAVNDQGPGWRLVTACKIDGAPYASILVDRGLTSVDAPIAKADGPANPDPVIGVLRRAPRPGFASAPHTPGSTDWYARDLPGMAAALGAANPAPVFLILESPDGAPGGPKPTSIPVEVRDNLQYAFTWFGLAAALIGVYIATQVARRRKA